MHMVYSERTQVLLSPQQRSKLEHIASRTRKSVGAVIRDAIDAYQRSTDDERLAAIDTILSLDLPVEDWPAMKRDILRRALKDQAER